MRIIYGEIPERIFGVIPARISEIILGKKLKASIEEFFQESVKKLLQKSLLEFLLTTPQETSKKFQGISGATSEGIHWETPRRILKRISREISWGIPGEPPKNAEGNVNRIPEGIPSNSFEGILIPKRFF